MKKESLPKQIENLSKEIIRANVKVYLSVLGPLGTAIDEMLFGIADRIRARRLEKFVKVLSETLSKVDENKLDSTFLQSEEFFDLNIRIFNAAVKSRHEEKYKILSNVFLNKVLNKDGWKTELIEIFVNIIDEFSTNHITVFKYLVENINTFKEASSYEQLYEGFVTHHSIEQIDKYEFRLYCRDIEHKSLLRFGKLIDEYGGSSGVLSHGGDYGITLTSMGEMFIQILEKNTSPT